MIALLHGRIVDPADNTDALGDLFIADGKIAQRPADLSGWTCIDCTDRVVAPAFVDLHAALPDLAIGEAAALSGGYGTVVLSPANGSTVERPGEARDLIARSAGLTVRIAVSGALTVGLRGEEIADVGLLVAAGCAALSNGSTPVRSARVMRHLLEYAGRLGRPVFLRAADPDLDAGGVVREGPRAAWLGLPSVPPEAEEIGISTVAALVRRTGTAVHLTHLWSARGIDALRRARAEGLPITATTTAYHLALSDDLVDETAYAGSCRFVPPLGDVLDRRALVEALADGTLAGVATDHRPVPLHLQDRELELAVPGSLGLQTAFPLVLSAVGDVVAAIRALASGPAAVLGRVARLRAGDPADVTILDVNEAWVVGPATLGDAPHNTPIVGRTVRGRPVRTFVAGRSAM